jgi:hypothetical protein
VEGSPLVFVELVVLIIDHQVKDRALRQINWFVDDKPSMCDSRADAHTDTLADREEPVGCT